MTKRLKSKFGVCKKLNRNYNNIWGLPKGESLRCVNNENKKKEKAFSIWKIVKGEAIVEIFLLQYARTIF